MLRKKGDGMKDKRLKRRQVLSMMGATLVPVALPIGSYSILFSLFANRSNATNLKNTNVKGIIYVFVGPITDLTRVQFYVDNPQHVGNPYRTENASPFDLAGTAPDNTAYPYDTKQLPDGPHSVTVALTKRNGPVEYMTANFTVTNAASVRPGNLMPLVMLYA